MKHTVHIPPVFVRRLINGEEEALKALLDLLGPKVYGYCIKKTGSRADAEELVLDVFLKLWQFRSRLDPQADLQVLLFTIARNHILNFIRYKATRQLVQLAPGEAALSAAEEQWQRLDYNELYARYQRVLDGLGEKQRTVFRLSREAGLSNREIADRLGISVRTVEAHIHSCLKVIRTELKDSYILLLLIFFR